MLTKKIFLTYLQTFVKKGKDKMQSINKKILLSIFKSIVLPLVITGIVIITLPKLIGFFLPFLLGWLIACVASPMVKFIESKLKIHCKAGAAFVISLSIALIVFLIYLVIDVLITQSIAFAKTVPDIVSNVSVAFSEIKVYVDNFLYKLPSGIQEEVFNAIGEAGSYLSNLVSKSSSFFMNMASDIVKQIPMALLSTVVCILSAYFFVAEKKDVTDIYKNKCPERVKNVVSLIINGTKQAIGGYFVAQVKIEIFVYICLLIGFLLLRVNFAWLVALGIAILDFLPIFGTGTAIVPWAIIEAVNGNYITAVVLFVICGLSQLLRQFLQPKFVSHQVGLSEFATLFLLYAGFVFGGVIGMIISVPIGIVVVSLYQAGVFNPLIEEWKVLFHLIKYKCIPDKEENPAIYLHKYAIYESYGLWRTTVYDKDGKRKMISCKTKEGLYEKLRNYY